MSRLFVRGHLLSRPAQAAVVILLLLLVAAFLASRAADDSASDFRIISAPERLPNGMWRVTWESMPGRTYSVERAAGDDLNNTNWLHLQQVVASSILSFFDDTNSPMGRRYYRIRLEPEVPTGGSAQDLTRDPSYFAAVDANGQPINGMGVIPNPDGSLPAFEFRPGGASSAGAGQGLYLRIGSGARVRTNDGVQVIEFTTAALGFGPRSPFQLRAPLSITNAVIRTIGTRGVDVRALLAAFGRDPNGGLELVLFGRFPLRLMEGTVTPEGIRGARMEMIDFSLPLPAGSHVYANATLELDPDGSVRIPFSGAFSFDDGSGKGAQLNVPPARPLWLELRADGGMALGGRADLQFNPGPGFQVDFEFDDPSYRLAMSARGLNFSGLNILNTLFPSAPGAPASSDPSVLSATTEQLRCFEMAAAQFAALSRAETAFDGSEAMAFPPEAITGPAGLLEAWSYAALCSTGMDAGALSNSVAHAASAASAASSIKTVLDLRLALLRLKLAFSLGGLAAHAGVQGAVDAALQEVTAAIVLRAGQPDVVRTLAAFQAIVRCMLVQHQLQQQLALAEDSDLNEALGVLVERFTQDFTARNQVSAGVYVAAAGSPISVMTRAEAALALKDAAEVLKTAQLIGMDSTIAAPMGEMMAQFANQLWTLASAELLAAETAADYTAFLAAMEDVLELIAVVQSGIIPTPALGTLPGASTLNTLAGRLGAVFEADLQRQANAAQGAAAPMGARRAKVVNGRPAVLPIPHQVALVRRPYDGTGMRDQAFCGGSILSSRWILTAAHCVTNKPADSLAVLVGITDLNSGHTIENYFEVARVIMHPFYTNINGAVEDDYDVALLQLNEEIDFDAFSSGGIVLAEPIRLLTAAEGALGQPATGAVARISGWGLTVDGGVPPAQLMFADVAISGPQLWPTQSLSSRMILAGSANGLTNVCSGDSGGPLVVAGALAGVASFVSLEGCATPGYPGGFARVSSFEPWISHYVSGSSSPHLLRAIERVVALAETTDVDARLRVLYQRGEAALAAATTEPGALSAPDVVEAIRLGNLLAQLRYHLELDSPAWWEEVAMQALVTRLLELASLPDDGSTAPAIHRSMRLLLNHADWLAENSGSAALRQKCIARAAALAFAAGEKARAAFEAYLSSVENGSSPLASGRNGKTTGTGGAPADMLLPGEIQVNRVAGSVSYNRETRDFKAAFSGELQLPGYDLTLTVNNASIASGGVFDLSAHGSVAFPPGNPQGHFTVPTHRPLHIQSDGTGRLQFSGGGRVALNNGMAFEAFVQVEDPLYRFGLSAEGIRFDVADNLRVMVPTLPDGEQFSAAVTRDLNEYFRNLSSTLQQAGEFTAPEFRQPGQPPEFTAPTITLPLADLEAWANHKLADAHLNVTRDYSATLASAKQSLRAVASLLRDRRGEISPEELDMRLRLLAKICAATEVQRATGQNAEADELVNSPEFKGFMEETEAAVMALLQRAPARDEAYQDAALESMGKFQKWAPCLDEPARLRVVTALETYQVALWTAFASSNGISATTGLVSDAARMPTNYQAARPVFLRYLNLTAQHQLLGLASPSDTWVRQVGQTLAMNWRAQLLDEIRTVDITKAENYTHIGFVTRDLALLLCAGQQALFDYPSDPIPQLNGGPAEFSLQSEMRNTYLRRVEAEAFTLITNRLSGGHVDKFTFVTRPEVNFKAAHIFNIENLACKLREPRDPVSQYIWSILSENTKETLINYRPGTYRLTACDFIDPGVMAARINGSDEAGTNFLTYYLWNQFSGGGQQVLLSPGASEYDLRWALSRELNDIIKGPSFHTPQRFSGITLSSRVTTLLSQNPQGAELEKLNRWLLEEAFTNVVRVVTPLGTMGPGLKNSIAVDLDNLIKGPLIYNPQVFAGVRLAPDTQEYLASGEQAAYANRRLLEDAYPDEFPRQTHQEMRVYYPAIELLRAPQMEDPNQCGLEFESASTSEREIIQVADYEFATTQLDAAEVRLLQTGTTGDLQGAIKLLKELIWLAGWAEQKQLTNAPQFNLKLKQLTHTFTELAAARQAWWYLGEYTDILLEAVESGALAAADTTRALVEAEANNVLRTSWRLLSSLSTLAPGQRPVDLPLPGDIYVDRVFGEITYRRDTGEVSGKFGGRVEFPDLQNAYFEISNATLDSHLNFSIAAATAGPLPFGGAWVSATIDASGGTNRPLQFAGTGQLSVTNGPSLAVSVAFDSGTRTLSFDTAATGLETWRLTDDLVLFEAGLGFTVQPANQFGELRANGAAGFFAKGELPSTNQPLSRTNFHLFAENVRAAVQFQPGQVHLVFSNGTLHLPTFFYPSNMAALCPGAPAGSGPSISLEPANPIQATVFLAEPPTLPRAEFSGELDFRHFGFEMPGIPGLAAAVCSARLRFSDDTLPYLTNVNATLQIPLPRSTNHVDLENGVFSLTGYPSGRVELREDLPLVDLAGFKVTVLGQGHPECPQGSGLMVYPTSGFQNLPAFQIDGGLRVEAPASMLTGVTNDTAYGLACGGISVTNGELPRLHVDALAFGGTFHVGGASGLLLSNAAISFEGVENAITPSEQDPFIVRLGGTLSVPNGPAFSLNNARFTFVAYDRLPFFAVDGIGFNASQFDLVQGLPAGIDKATFTLKNSNLPLPHVLNPTNIDVSLSAFVSIPPGEDKFIGGRIDNIKVTIGADGIPRMGSIAGLLLEVGSMSIPPIEEIGAKLYIGGLENLNPSEMYFVGRGAGSYQGYRLKLMMAFNLAGPIGMCMDVNAGAAGIPLGQTTFLFTGAGGGVSFLNNGEDPCEFTTYVDPDGKPLSSIVGGFPLPNVMDWATLQTTIERMTRTAAAYASNLPPPAGAAAAKSLPLQANGFDCPGGCPPPTVNIFCQPHPDPVRYPNRVIMKFTSIDEPTLNNVFQITPENIAALGSGAAQVAANFAHQVRLFVETNIPPFDPAFGGNSNAIRAAVTETLDAMESGFSTSLSAILSTNNANAFYTVIREAAYVGAPCPDITMKVFGTFSQAAVSSFLSATVAGQITTAGNCGVMGHVNFLGIPVGKGKLFVAATDDRGLPNPSACGEIEVAFGPLDLGLMRGEMSCRDCVTGILREFYKLAQCISEPVLRQLASNAAPRLAVLNLPPAQLLNQMTDVEKLGFMAEVYQLPPGVLAGLPQCFVTQFHEAMDVFQPYMVLCGVIEPRLFGLPLMGGRVAEASVEMSKTNIAGLTIFSPSQVLAWAYNLASASVRQLFPFEDIATFGFNVSYPDPAEALLAGMEGKLSSSNAVAGYAAQQFDQMLQRATYVTQFELKPLGGKGLETQARIVLPNFTNHPARPGSTWDFPERVHPTLPSREDLLLALLEQDKLVDPFWTGDNLGDVDPRLAGYNLRKDYFPHGGFMGAAKIAMPKALTETPPAYLPALLNPNSAMTPLDRLLNGLDYAQNYLASFTNRGSLAFYVPSPNPPFFTNSAGQNIGPREMLEAIGSFDFKSITNAQIASLYPFEAGFVKGYFNATLLGIPMATGLVVALPPAPDEGRPDAVMRLEVAATPEGWMSHFVTTNNLIVEMRGAPPRPIESWANEVVLELATLAVDPAVTEAQITETVSDLISSIETNLPKMRLEADLQFGFPPPISDVVAMRSTTRLHAYSPKYDPAHEPQDSSPMARIKREGGIAFQGDARLKVGPLTLVDIDTAEFSLVPVDEGLPEISARLVADTIPFPPDLPITTFRDVNIDLATAPRPYFRGSGRLDVLSFGSFRLVGDPAFQLGGSFEVASRAGGGVDTRLSINPAVMIAGYYGEKVLIHGATRNDPFTLSTTGPWTASVELTNNLNLLNLVEMGAGGLFAPITLSGNGTNMSFTVGFGPGAGLTLLPGVPALRTNITLQAGAAGSLTLNNNGRFMMTAQLGGTAFSFNNFSIPSGATLTASNEGVSISWFINNGTTTASISFGTNGAVAFSGNTELPPLNTGIFTLSGLDGGNLRGGFNNEGFAVSSGALLKMNADWLNYPAVAVSSFTISNNGAISIAVTNSPGTVAFAGYPFDLTHLTFTRTPTNSGGIANVGLAGTLKTNLLFPGVPFLAFTGSVSSAGELLLRSGAANTVLFGFPVQNFSNVLSISVGEYDVQLEAQFRLGNNSGLWSTLGSNWFTGTLASDGRASFAATSPVVGFAGFSINNSLFGFGVNAPALPPVVRLEGDVTISGFPLLHLAGNFDPNGGAALTVLTPNAFPYPQFDANVALTLGNSGMSASGTLRLPPLPNVSLSGAIQSDGAYALSGNASGALAGFALNSGTVTLQRVAAQSATVSITSAALAVPGFGTRTFSGSFTNDGTFLVTHTAAGGVTFAPALPVPGMSGNVAFRLSQSGMALNGTLLANAGVLSTVLPRGTAAGVLSVTAAGGQSLSAQVTIAPITNGGFRITRSGGGDFVASLDNAGLHISGGAELSYSNYFTAPVPLPAIDIESNGNFAASVGDPVPVSLTFRGFGLSDVRFMLQRAAGVVEIRDFDGSVNLGPLGRVAAVSGSMNRDGTFALAGTFGSVMTLTSVTPPLPVTTLGTGAQISFNQSGLTITGELSGGVINAFSATAAGVLNVTPTTVSLGGTVTIPPILAGVFRIEPADNSSVIAASWNNNSLRLPTNLRLRFNGATLTTNTAEVTVGSDGSFTITRNAVSLSIGGFLFSNGGFSFTRTPAGAGAGITNISLAVPGLDSPMAVSVNGALRSDGTYSFASTATATSGPTFGGPTPLVKLNVGASVGLTNGVCVVRGTFDLSQGVLALVTEIGSVSGGFRITTSPTTVSLFGEATHAALDFGSIDVRPIGGGNFTSILDNEGLQVPSGAQLYFNNALLGSFTLPSITIPAGGAFSQSFGPVSMDIENFDLTASATLARNSAGVATVAINSGTSLLVPGLNVSVNVTGTMTNNGTFLIANNAAGTFTLPNLPITSMANTVVALGRSSGAATLRLSGNVAGGLLGGNGNNALQLVNANVGISVSSSGSLGLNANVSARYFDAGVFVVEGNGNLANITANLNNNFLVLSNARLRATSTAALGAAVNLPTISIPISGEFDLPVTLPVASALGVRGFNFTNVVFNLRRFAPNGSGIRDLRVQGFRGRLAIANFTQPFTGGVIFSDGSPEFDWTGNLVLAGFTAANGQLSLRSDGMHAQGQFNLTAAGHTFNGAVQFEGPVQSGGTFNLDRVANLNMDGYGFTASPTLRLSSSGISLPFGASLDFGGFPVPLNGFSLTSNGVSFTGSATRDTQWLRFFDAAQPPAPLRAFPTPYTGCSDNGDVYGRVSYTVSLSASQSSGAFSATGGGSFGWWVTGDNFDCYTEHTGSDIFGDYTYRRWCCNSPPGGFPGGQTSVIPTTNIGSSGLLCVNQNQGGQPSFYFRVWPNVGLGSSNGRCP